MMRKTGIIIAILAGAALLGLGCSSPLNNGGGSTAGGQRYIKLTISTPSTARSITVTEYQVTGMNIEVRDPDDELLQTIAWDASEGSRTYMIPVHRSGEHELTVTQFGENGGVTVEATESASFNIEAMKITVIEIVPGSIAQIVVAGEVIDPLAWIIGKWVEEEPYAPFTGLTELDSNHRIYHYDNADETVLLDSGTWTFDGNVLTVTLDSGETGDVQVHQLGANEMTWEMGGRLTHFYRLEPENSIFRTSATELSQGITADCALTEDVYYLCSFTAPAAGSYDVSWDDSSNPAGSYTGSVGSLNAYRFDETTAIFTEVESSPPAIYLDAGETAYIIISPNQAGLVGILVQAASS